MPSSSTLFTQKEIIMYKLAIFDLDDTLAPTGKGILPENIKLLKTISDKVQITICSGKPVYYLCGFMRQAGINNAVLMGENGSAFQFGTDLPPSKYGYHPLAKNAKASLSFLKDEISRTVPGIWYQPNEIAVTPFPKSEQEFELIEACLQRCNLAIRNVTVYRHDDSFDIVPKGVNKQTGAEYLGNMLGILPSETIAIGDGVNDYPLFEYAGHSIGVCVSKPEKVDVNYNSITQALNHVLEVLSVT